jgi:hypothetical protein
MTHVAADQFTNRFVTLILGGRVMPKKLLDQHVLFFSATLALEPGRVYTEKEINEILGAWSTRFGGNFDLDHVTLRRYLVDAGYLERDDSGASYRLGQGETAFAFDESIKQLDLAELISEAVRARELRKQQYMKRPGT